MITPPIPLHVSALFIALVFGIAFFSIIAVHVCGLRGGLAFEDRRRNLSVTILFLLVWLAFTNIIAMSGLLADFTSMPPMFLLVVLPPFLFIAVLMQAKVFNDLSENISGFWFVYAQSFRILMEFILWLLYRYRIIPVQMTFEGLNFDILIGLSAPFVAYYCFIKKSWSWKVALGWNIAGLLLLANIVTVAVLSTPYPFRHFMNEPANTVIFNFPFVWLPSLVVPFALLLHLISIRRLLRYKAV